MSIAPVGDSNHVELHSTWPSPLFAGQFLPRTHDVGGGGFTAAWDVSSLATGTQVQMQANPAKPLDLMVVNLLTPIDPYKLSDRATKYGILFVILTFGGFFLFEVMKQLPIHPVQYLLVGFCLALFFLLLISFSEHMAFCIRLPAGERGVHRPARLLPVVCASQRGPWVVVRRHAGGSVWGRLRPADQRRQCLDPGIADALSPCLQP